MGYGRAVVVGAAFAATAFVLGAPRPAAVHAEGSAEDRAAFQSAQQQPSAAAPTLKVYSRETIVDVLVTDDKGQPVRGTEVLKAGSWMTPLVLLAALGTLALTFACWR